MTFATDASTIRSHFAAEWLLLRPTVPIAYDNIAFDPAVDALDPMGNPAPWVRFSILPGDAFQASLGTPKVWRSTGLVTVQVYVPVGQGDGLAADLADDASGIFRGVRLDGLIFRAPALTNIGEDGAWYQINVTTPYLAELIA